MWCTSCMEQTLTGETCVLQDRKKKHLTRRRLPSAPETQFLLIHPSFDPSVSYIIHSLPKLSFYVKLHAPPVFSLLPLSNSISALCSLPPWGHHEQRLRRRKCLCRATWEGLRKEMSKCLFTANWATDEPTAVSNEGPSRREEETSMKEER